MWVLLLDLASSAKYCSLSPSLQVWKHSQVRGWSPAGREAAPSCWVQCIAFMAPTSPSLHLFLPLLTICTVFLQKLCSETAVNVQGSAVPGSSQPPGSQHTRHRGKEDSTDQHNYCFLQVFKTRFVHIVAITSQSDNLGPGKSGKQSLFTSGTFYSCKKWSASPPRRAGDLHGLQVASICPL